MSEASLWALALPAAIALAVLVLPGLLIVAATGVRGVSVLLVAAPVSAAVVAVAAVGASIVGIDWGVLPVVVVACVGALVGAGARLALRRWWPATVRPALERERSGWTALLAVPVAGVVIGWQLLRAFGRPDAFSQTFDNVFHLNAIRFILDTHDASPLTILQMTAGEGPYGFYPATWHAIGSLVAQVSGASPAVAANAVNLVVAAVVWPLGATALTLTITRLRATTAVLAGVVMAGFSGFPYLLLDYGVLYPNFLSYALVPGVLALAVSAFGTCSVRLAASGPALLLAITGSVGVAVAHPNGAMLVLAIGLTILGAVALRLGSAWWSEGRTLRLVLLATSLVALIGLYAVVWRFIRPPASATRWPPTQTMPQAVGEVIFQAADHRAAGLGVAVLAVIGAVHLVRRRSRSLWIVAAWALVAFLFVVVSGVSEQVLRDLLTAVWYNNTPRLAAALPLVVAPIAAYGAVVSWEVGRARLAGRVPPRVVVALSVLGVLLLVGTVLRTSSAASERIRATMEVSADSRAVDSDEMALIRQLPDLLPDDALVAVNPSYGGAFAYALEGVDVTFAHLLHGPVADYDLIGEGLDEATPGSPVCEAVRTSGVTHVLDFGGDPIYRGNVAEMPGFDDLEDSAVVELVAREGDARLWAITGC